MNAYSEKKRKEKKKEKRRHQYIDDKAQSVGCNLGSDKVKIVNEMDDAILLENEDPVDNTLHVQLNSQCRKRDLESTGAAAAAATSAEKKLRRLKKQECEDKDDGDSEDDGEEENFPQRSLKEKIRVAKEANKKIEVGQFNEKIHCPLCHMICSESTGNNGKTNLWCSNRCELP